MVALLTPATAALLVVGLPTSGAAADNARSNRHSADEESKIQRALSHHAANAQHLLERSLAAGGAAIGPDGTVVGSASGSAGVQEELWKADFAVRALEEELNTLRMASDGAGGGNTLTNDDNDSDDGESDYENSSEDDYDEDSNDGNSSSDDDDYSYSELSPEDRAVLAPIKDKRYRNIVYNNLVNEADIRAEIEQHGYSRDELSYWELHALFTCHRIMAGNRPVYDAARWRQLRDSYNEFVAEDLKKDPIREGDAPRTYKFSDEAFDSPTDPFGVEDVSDSPEEDEEKGRGLKAARDIAKGELVFKATNNTVVFNVGHTWSSFLFHLYERNGEPYDAETTCDFMVWSWIQRMDDYEDAQLIIVNDMDNGSLLNEGRFDDPEYDPPNVRCGKEGDTICRMSYYALRDIKKGEELLCTYKDFALIWSWEEMGVGQIS